MGRDNKNVINVTLLIGMTKHIFWLASYPKSGNTLLRAILSSLFFTENGVFNFKLLESITSFEDTYFVSKMKKLI